MNPITTSLTLDINKDATQSIVRVKIHDTNSTELNISLVKKGKLVPISGGCMAVLRLGSEEYGKQIVNCKVENDCATVVLPQINAVGELKGELQIYDGQGFVITSAWFCIEVFDTAVDDYELNDDTDTLDGFREILDEMTATKNVTALEAEKAKAEADRTQALYESTNGLRGEKGEKGEKGDKGDTGPQGIQGQRGVQGPQGEIGPKGDKGDKGATGPIGPIGVKGDKGIQGVQGVQGPQGPRGEKGDKGDVGPQGIQGPKGDMGLTGPQGIKGDKGEDGTSLKIVGTYATLQALQTAVKNPVQGDMYNVGTVAPYEIFMWQLALSKWESQGRLQGPKGDKGDTGLQGPAGKDGVTGPQGLKGDAGPQGPPGPQGLKGDTGPQGLKGATGPQGIQGPKGDTGAVGPQGIQGPKGEKGDIGPQGPPGSGGGGGGGLTPVELVNIDIGDPSFYAYDISAYGTGYYTAYVVYPLMSSSGTTLNSATVSMYIDFDVVSGNPEQMNASGGINVRSPNDSGATLGHIQLEAGYLPGDIYAITAMLYYNDPALIDDTKSVLIFKLFKQEVLL